MNGRFAFLVRGPAIFQNFHCAAALFAIKRVAKNNHVVGDKFFHAVAGDFAVLVNAFSGHQGRDAESFQSQRHAQHFAAHNRSVGKLGKNRPDGIHCQPFRADFLDGVVNSRHQRP